MLKLGVSGKFLPEHKNLFDNAYGKLKWPLAEHSFAWIYLWDICYKDVEWKIINQNLCLFLAFDRRRYVWGPVLPGNKLQETVEECFDLCQDYNNAQGNNLPGAAMYIPKELKEKYSGVEGFEINEQDKDYIYKVSDIVELKGKRYKDKRNKRNYFFNNYKFVVAEYSKNLHINDCLKLLRLWRMQKEKVNGHNKEKLEWEVGANVRMLKNSENLDVKGMVVIIEGKVQGFIFGSKSNAKLCTMFFGKTNLEFKGMSQFIYGEFLNRFFSECEYVNDGEDWGVDYLSKSKKSYNPEIINQSYMLVKSN